MTSNHFTGISDNTFARIDRDIDNMNKNVFENLTKLNIKGSVKRFTWYAIASWVASVLFLLGVFLTAVFGAAWIIKN
jgi:Holliday junction resolvase RusA-like endonuclease